MYLGKQDRQDVKDVRNKNVPLFGDLRYGEFGFSVQLTPNNEEVISGSPGVYNWAGRCKFIMLPCITNPENPFIGMTKLC